MVLKMEVEKAVKMFRDGEVILVVLWKDGYLSVCKLNKVGGACYTTSRPSKANKQLYYMAQAFYSNLGFKIEKLA